MGINDLYIVGIYIDDYVNDLYAIYDSQEHQIFLIRRTHPFEHETTIPQEYKGLFVRLSPPSPSHPRSQSPSPHPIPNQELRPHPIPTEETTLLQRVIGARAVSKRLSRRFF